VRVRENKGPRRIAEPRDYWTPFRDRRGEHTREGAGRPERAHLTHERDIVANERSEDRAESAPPEYGAPMSRDLERPVEEQIDSVSVEHERI
jgi:hypothetical protein